VLGLTLFQSGARRFKAQKGLRALWRMGMQYSVLKSFRGSPRRYTSIRWWAITLIAAAAFGTNRPSLAEEQPPKPAPPLKSLDQADQREAAAAAFLHADRMRVALQKRILDARHGKKPPFTATERAPEAAKVVEAYEEVIRRYPRTSVAAYSAIILSHFYDSQGDFQKAVDLAAATAKEYAGTPSGLKALYALGTIHARHDVHRAEAIQWFSQIPKPPKPAGATLGADETLYLLAQAQCARCEAAHGRRSEAEQRISQLKQAYPQCVKKIDQQYGLASHSRSVSFGQQISPAAGAAWRYVLLGLAVVLCGVFCYKRYSVRARLPAAEK